MSETEIIEIEELAMKLHSIYEPECKLCSYTDSDWKAAKMVLQQLKPQETKYILRRRKI